jgi:restriction system protein
MAAWIWRSGQRGGFDDLAFRQGVVVLGMYMVDDLTGHTTRDEIRALVTGAFPTAPSSRVETMAAQLYSFRHTIAVGDLVIMLSNKSTKVAIGEVTGGYAFHPGPGDRLHLRPVQWLRQGVERVAVGPDLLRSPAATAIYRIQAADAEARLRAVVASGRDSSRRRPVPAPRVEASPETTPDVPEMPADGDGTRAGRPFARLKRNLDYARNLARAGEALQGADTDLLVDITDVYRAAWVQACTALEHWVRTEVTYRALVLGRSPHPPQRIQALASLARGKKAARQPGADQLREGIKRYHGNQSYLQPEKIKKAFSLVATTRTLWQDVAAFLRDDTTTSPYDGMPVEQALRQIMSRRNAIAHSYDEDQASPGTRRPLTDGEVTAMIDWLERLAAAIRDALPSPVAVPA